MPCIADTDIIELLGFDGYGSAKRGCQNGAAKNKNKRAVKK